uniref:Uncharacterized protein n=1 Tax=Panagrolaimus sp. PS1159 TaxID=55785 RepID=A0AC35G468_9BILA
MVNHVGIYPSINIASIYNSLSGDVNEVEIAWSPDYSVLSRGVNRGFVDLIRKLYDTIKSNIKGELGCVSVVLEKYDNLTRKNFILFGTEAGFEKIEIISPQTELYLHATFYSKYIPKNDDFIWIYRFPHWHIWEKRNGIAKYIDSIPHNEIKGTLTKSPYNQGSNVVLIGDNSKVNNLPLEPKILQYQFQSFFVRLSFLKTLVKDFKPNEAFKRGPLVHVRLMANEEEMTEYGFQNVSDREIALKMGNQNVAKFQSSESLPLKCFITFKNQNQNRNLTIESEQNSSTHFTQEKLLKYEENITLPPYDNAFITFSIDENGIYSINIQELSPEIFENIDEFMDVYYGNASVENLSIAKVAEQINDRYVIPKRIFTNDERINAVGIDLGTTRCCAAVNRKNGIQTAPLDNLGQRLLPSYVAYNEENIICGQEVVNRMQHYSASTVFDSKRILGKTFEKLKIDESWTFKVTDNNGKINIKVQRLDNEISLSPEEVSGALLQHVKKEVEKHQGKKLTEVVITIPAAFSDVQKQATYDAAVFAGWEKVHLLPEPVAAAFAYFVDQTLPDNSIFLLLDLGGGTLDVCIFKVIKNHIEIICRSGDPNFGGRDFDNLLVDYFKKRLENDFQVVISGRRKYKLMQLCQEIKHDLTVCKDYKLDVEDFDVSKENLCIPITQEQFYDISTNLIEKLKRNIEAALNKAGYTKKDINKVLYVGGGCRMPKVEQLLKKMFPNVEHCCQQNPDEVVAIGAAYYSYYLNCEKGTENETIKLAHFVNYTAHGQIKYFIPSRCYDYSVDAVGIDLGTTNCYVAVNRMNGIEILAFDSTGQRLLPSYVAYDEEQPKVGQVAVDRMRKHAESTVFDIKKLLGKKLHEIHVAPLWEFSVANVKEKAKIQLNGPLGVIWKYPEKVCSDLLKHIKLQTEKIRGKMFDEAVIAVPLTFNEKQRDAVRAAALLAGWKKIHLLPEPVAATIAYFCDRSIPNGSKCLVIDLGGATLDICIFHYNYV